MSASDGNSVIEQARYSLTEIYQKLLHKNYTFKVYIYIKK